MRPPPRPRRVAPVAAGPTPPPARPASAPATSPATSPATKPATNPATKPPTVPPEVVRRPDEVVVATPGTFTDLRRWRPSRPPVVSTGSAARFAERVTLRRNLARRRLVIAGGAVAGLAAVAWTLFFSPVLALDTRDLQVEGEGTVVDVSAVAAVVQVQDGTPLPRLDTVALRRAILDVPGVRAAVVARAWPHGLHITVVSREPVAAVPDGHGFALLDVEGVQVGRGDAPPDGLPVVSVPRDDKDARAMTAVLAVLQELPPELAAQVVSASADTRDTVALGLSDGAKVEWGSPEDGALKVRVLTTLRAAEASKGAAVFDVSAPTLPITRS